MSTYLYTGDHADTLHAGRRVAPGDDVVPASAVTPDQQPDQTMLADGVLQLLDGEKFDVAAASIDAVVKWVGNDHARRQQALAVEEARGSHARSTLIDKLTTKQEGS